MNKNIETFKGGQNGSRCKIQAIYGLIESTLNCDIKKANCNDQSYKDHLNYVKKDSLMIFDLGYFAIESFKQILLKGGNFLSRYLRNTIIFDVEGIEINMEDLLRNSGVRIDTEILLGRKDKIARDCKRSGKKAKEALKETDFGSLYVTNLTKETAEEAHNLYSLRWQIELLFKMLKSQFSMGEIKAKNVNRASITIYAKLILAVIGIILIREIEDEEISLYKAMNYYKNHFKDIYHGLVRGKTSACKIFLEIVKKFAKKSSRQNRPSTLMICGLQPIFSSA